MLACTCPGCGRKLKFKEEMAGKTVRCLHCSKHLHLPARASSPGPLADDLHPTEKGESMPSRPKGPVRDEETLPLPRPTHQGEDAETAADISSANRNREHPDELVEFLHPPEERDEIGRLGPYRVLAVLGAGGMGVVYKAEDPKLQRLVALKVMLPSVATNASARERFLREAQAAAAIKHDHIVTIHQVGQDRDIPFLAMEFLEGESLEQRLAREAPLPVEEILRIGQQIADGLAGAHGRGLLHRDIKPANIWLEASRSRRNDDRADRIKILDFGLARAFRRKSELTEAGAILGTPAYMSPEQVEGQTVDARADLFSLGCVLYRMATGERAFEGDTAFATLTAVTSENPKLPKEINAEVPAALSELVMKLLAKNPKERPASAQAVVRALKTIEKSLSAEATPGKTLVDALDAQEKKRAGQFRRLYFLVGGGLAGAVLLLGALLFITRTPTATVVLNVGVDLADKGLSFFLDGEPVSAEALAAPLELTVGEHELLVKRNEAIVKRMRFSVQGGRTPTIAYREVEEIEQPKRKEVLSAGGLLGPLALVTHPAALPGVRSWTIETVLPRGNLPYTRGVAISPDSKTLAVCGADGVIRLWDLESGRLERVLLGHDSAATALAWSPSGKVLTAGTGNGGVVFWESTSGRLLRKIKLDQSVADLAWSPDGKYLGLRAGGLLQLWEDDTNELLPALPVPNGPFCWSPDSASLAVAGGKTIKVFHLDSPKASQTLPGHEGNITDLAWSSDRKLLASASQEDQTVRLWNPITGAAGRMFGGKAAAAAKVNWDYHGSPSLAWSPDGKLLASGGRQRGQLNPAFTWAPEDVAILDPISGERRALWTGTQSYTAGLAWSRDGNFLAAASMDRKFNVYKAPDFKPHFNFAPHQATGTVTSGTFWSPDSRQLIYGFFAWDLALGGRHESGKLPFIPTGVSWSTDGGIRALRDPSGPIALVSGASPKPFATLKAKPGPLALSPDGRWLATASENAVQIWDAANGKELRSLDGHTKPVKVLAWTPDSKLLATGGDDDALRVWDGASWATVRTLKGLNSVGYLAWSRDGRELAAATPSYDEARVWRTADGQLLHSLKAEPGIAALAWSASGTSFLGLRDGTVRRYDTASLFRRNLFTLPRKENGEFSPDGALLVTNPSYAVLSFWEAESGSHLGVLALLGKDAWLTISPEGHFRGPAGIEKEIVYVVQTERGQETLAPEEFTQKYGWQNDPKRVRLAGK